MTQFLAVDWDGIEIRAVLAASQRGSIKVFKAESIPLEFRESTENSPSQADVGQSLKTLLKRCEIPKSRFLLGLNRESIEMLTFPLPKAKPEELPDLVKNQVLRDSPSFSENQPLDFVTYPSSEGDSIRTIAATISRAQLREYRSIAQTAGLRAKRIEFRLLALAELYLRSNVADNAPRLLVQCTADEIDMIVVAESHVVFVRSIRLPESLGGEDKMSRIAAEITRTIAVSRQDLEGATLEKIIIFGDSEEYQFLQERLTDQELNAQILNPFRLSCVQIPARAKITGAEVSPGHYAALLGMILSEQSKSPTRIDFLHTREKPQPLNIARFIVLFMLLVGIIGYGAYAWNSRVLKQMENQLTNLTDDVKKLQAEYGQLNPEYVQLYSAATWENQQLIWLDELRDISVRLPPEQDLMITRMQYSSGQRFNNQTCGAIDLTGRIRDLNVLALIKRTFDSDRYHYVQILAQQPNQRGGGYPYSFSIRIYTFRQPPQIFVQRLTPELQRLSRTMPDLPQAETNPVSQQTQNSQATPQDSNTVSEVLPNLPPQQTAPEPPKLKHIYPPQYVPNLTAPAQTIWRHVLPARYVPQQAKEENNQETPQTPAVKHVYPGGYLMKDALMKQTQSEISVEKEDSIEKKEGARP
ncbi:MAG: hypothetical protein LBJ67_01545 [Planctomycetaceae bacterium]|nr:hypothetical protein [Planctomycetaceae bacterium]